jgi:hypothetical protein
LQGHIYRACSSHARLYIGAPTINPTAADSIESKTMMNAISDAFVSWHDSMMPAVFRFDEIGDAAVEDAVILKRDVSVALEEVGSALDRVICAETGTAHRVTATAGKP